MLMGSRHVLSPYICSAFPFLSLSPLSFLATVKHGPVKLTRYTELHLQSSEKTGPLSKERNTSHDKPIKRRFTYVKRDFYKHQCGKMDVHICNSLFIKRMPFVTVMLPAPIKHRLSQVENIFCLLQNQIAVISQITFQVPCLAVIMFTYN